MQWFYYVTCNGVPFPAVCILTPCMQATAYTVTQSRGYKYNYKHTDHADRQYMIQ